VLFDAPEGAVSSDSFRPSSDRFGSTAGQVIRCLSCGHGSLRHAPAIEVLGEVYGDAADPVSLAEEAGQVETGRRGLAQIERFVKPGRVVDFGCWTGSFLAAARSRGWDALGIEPSRWASNRARERGLDVRTIPIEDHNLEHGTFSLIVMCDVIEHLIDPGAGLDRVSALLAPGGVLYLTLPDAGSALARALGSRWWSVLPMHVQYFTRASLTRLLEQHGFTVRSISTHAKVFSARYYADRLGAFVPPLKTLAAASIAKIGLADRLIAPDFHDRMAVIATR